MGRFFHKKRDDGETDPSFFAKAGLRGRAGRRGALPLRRSSPSSPESSQYPAGREYQDEKQKIEEFVREPEVNVLREDDYQDECDDDQNDVENPRFVHVVHVD